MEDEYGREILDPTPVEVPSGLKRPESIEDMLRRMVRTHVSESAERNGFETFQESNDFELPDDDFDLPLTEHERRVMELEYPTEEDREVVRKAAAGSSARESERRVVVSGAGVGKAAKAGGVPEEGVESDDGGDTA